MDNWMVVTFDFGGIMVAGIIQEFDFDPDEHKNVLPSQKFADDAVANGACEVFARQNNLPLFGDIVRPDCACPQCDNRYMDKLDTSALAAEPWNQITCMVCGAQYEI